MRLKWVTLLKDSLDNTDENVGYYEVKNSYAAHIDKCYFFKFFEDVFWIEITSENYIAKKESCTEYDIPNDNELSIPSKIIE